METADQEYPESIGRYHLVRLVGQGAMGRVLLARDPVLDREVAVKLLRDDLKIPEEQRHSLLDRMRHEARASARVSHPNIVTLFDMGEDEQLGLYLVFEYAEGVTLKERLKRGPLGPKGAARLAREIGDALTTAHSAGVLHRDVKPENIILTRTGAKIADFGIARVPDSTLTRDGGLLGTPAYSAPEAIATGTFSPLSDQFSMACTLYEAISGFRAFPGEDAVAVATKISTEEPLKVSCSGGHDTHVDAVLFRGLSKDPKFRFESCLQFGEALAEALELNARTNMPTLPDSLHQEAMSVGGESRTARIALGGAAVGVLLTIAGFQLTADLRQPDTSISAASVSSGATRVASPPIGWLAESPELDARQRRTPRRRKRSRHSPPPTKASPDAGKAHDAATTAAEPDAGQPNPTIAAPKASASAELPAAAAAE